MKSMFVEEVVQGAYRGGLNHLSGRHGHMVGANGRKLYKFEQENKGGVWKVEGVLEFAASISAVVWECDRRFMLMGDSQGVLHFISTAGFSLLCSFPCRKGVDFASLQFVKASAPATPLDTDKENTAITTSSSAGSTNHGETLVAVMVDGAVLEISSIPVLGLCAISKGAEDAPSLAQCLKALSINRWQFLLPTTSAGDDNDTKDKGHSDDEGGGGQCANGLATAAVFDAPSSPRMLAGLYASSGEILVGGGRSLEGLCCHDLRALPGSESVGVAVVASGGVALFDARAAHVLASAEGMAAVAGTTVRVVWLRQLDMCIEEHGGSAWAVGTADESGATGVDVWVAACTGDGDWLVTPLDSLPIGNVSVSVAVGSLDDGTGGCPAGWSSCARNKVTVQNPSEEVVQHATSFVCGLLGSKSQSHPAEQEKYALSMQLGRLVRGLQDNPSAAVDMALKMLPRIPDSPTLARVVRAVFFSPDVPEELAERFARTACDDHVPRVRAVASSSDGKALLATRFVEAASVALCTAQGILRTSSEGMDTDSPIELARALVGFALWRDAGIAAGSVWLACVGNGHLQDAAAVLETHMRWSGLEGVSPTKLGSALADMPVSTDEDALAEFVRRCVLPRVRMMGGNQGPNALPVRVAIALCERARLSEETTHMPFKAVALIEIVQELEPVLAAHSPDDAELCAGLVEAVRLQVTLWCDWGVQSRLAHVEAGGLEGFIHGRLSGVEESQLEPVLYVNLCALVVNFGHKDDAERFVDGAIVSWVALMVGQKIVMHGPAFADTREDDDVDDDGEEEGVVRMSRLLACVKLVQTPNARASATLQLMQISGEDDEESTSKAASLVALVELAEVLLRDSGLSHQFRDSLTEALHLQALHVQVRSYGISGVDFRRRRHVTSIASLMASKIHRAGSLADASDFASKFPSVVDMDGVYCRAIVHRVMAPCDAASSPPGFDARARDEAVRYALRSVPSSYRCRVVEDVCSVLLGTIRQILEDAGPGSRFGLFEDKADVVDIVLACRGAMIVVTAFLDGLAPTGGVREVDEPAAQQDVSQWVHNRLLRELQRLHLLQSAHGIFLSLDELRDQGVRVGVVQELARERTEELVAGTRDIPCKDNDSGFVTITAPLRRAVGLLYCSPVGFCHTVMKLLVAKKRHDMAVLVARGLGAGIQGSVDITYSTHSAEDEALIHDAALTLSSLASRQTHSTTQSFATVKELLTETCASCTVGTLGSILGTLSGADLVLNVHKRLSDTQGQGEDCGEKSVDESTEKGRVRGKENMSFFTPGHTYVRDGILLDKQVVLTPLLRYAAQELQRRRLVFKGHAVVSGSESDAGADMNALVDVLQRSENHMLAVQVLLGSWTCSTAKGQRLQTSMKALGRKVMSYREIDMTLSVACLSRVPYDTMVSELKSAIPSIQSNFTRLRTVAMVGEELARIWGNENLLMLFSNIQCSARWWHLLASHAVDMDPRYFMAPNSPERSKALRSAVPELMTRSNLDLDLVLEYCQQFEIEVSVAHTCFIEKHLLATPTAPHELSWMRQLRRAMLRMDETTLMTCMRATLPRIHALDYEKIGFVTSWLLDHLGDSMDDDDATVVCHSDLVARTEIATYRSYLTLVALLTVQNFPVQVVLQVARRLSGGSQEKERDDGKAANAKTGWAPGPYQSVSGIYRTRVPLWNLLQDPWAILDTLMRHVPGIAQRLSPLCTVLDLDMDDFHVRAAREVYNGAVAGCLVAAAGDDIPLTPIDHFTEAMSYVRSASKKARGWLWLYEWKQGGGEAVASDDDSLVKTTDGARSLEKALECLSVHMHVSPDGIVTANTMYCTDLALAADIMEAYVKLRCEAVIASWAADHPSCSADLFPTGAALAALLGNHTRLLAELLRSAVDIAWQEQLRATRTTPADLHTLEILTSIIAPSTLSLASSLGKLVAESAGVLGMLSTVQSASESSSASSGGSSGENSPVVSGPQRAPVNVADSSLEAARHVLLNELLMGCPHATESAGGDRDRSKAEATTVTAARRSEVFLCPSDAECRRGDDARCSFGCAVLLAACADMKHRSRFAGQLMAVAKGVSSSVSSSTSTSSDGGSSGGKVVGSVTVRARLRAIQALVLLRECDPAGRSGGAVLAALRPLRNFLFCQAELLEVRINCEKDTLYAALESPSRLDSLVRTWLHDEGHLDAVIELARDVLLCSGHDDEALWAQLLQHMAHRDMHRLRVVSLAVLPTDMPLKDALVHAEFRRGLASSVAQIIRMATDALLRCGKELSPSLSQSPAAEVARTPQFVSDGSASIPQEGAHEYRSNDAVVLLGLATRLVTAAGDAVWADHNDARDVIAAAALDLHCFSVGSGGGASVEPADGNAAARGYPFLATICGSMSWSLLLPSLSGTSTNDGSLVGKYMAAAVQATTRSQSQGATQKMWAVLRAACANGFPRSAIWHALGLVDTSVAELQSSSSCPSPSPSSPSSALLHHAALVWTRSSEDASTTHALLQWVVGDAGRARRAVAEVQALQPAARGSLFLAARRHGLQLAV